MTEITLTYYSDASHGWIKVPRKLVNDLSLDISSFSYVSKTGKTVYLEEDRDGLLLVKKLIDSDVKVNFKNIDHGDRSYIRNLERWNK